MKKTMICALAAFAAAAVFAQGNLRYSITVSKFENKSNWRGQWDLGNAWGTILTDQLVQSGRFIVLGEKDMRGEALAEAQGNVSAVEQLRAQLDMPGGYTLLGGEKIELIAKCAKILNLEPIDESRWNRKMNISIQEEGQMAALVDLLDAVMRVTVAKAASKELGFICLFTDGNGTYWFKVSRGFTTALNESLSSLEKLIDDTLHSDLSAPQKEKVNIVYRVLNGLYE